MSVKWRCPRCRASLEHQDGELRCVAADHRFGTPHGIPDLRVHGDPYLTVDDDLRAADALAARASGGFREMLASYYADNAKVSSTQADRFTAGVVAAGDRAVATLSTWEGLDPDIATPARWLDLGAGTAPLAIAATRRGHSCVALDAGLRWLVIARERCREAGVDVELVCANAECVPLGDAAVDVVAGESVIEGVSSQETVVAEARRVLSVDGRVLLTIPNRHFLGPDPHIGMLAGGWFSEERVTRYAMARGMVPPRRRLLTRTEAITLLTGARAFGAVRTGLSGVASSQRAALGLAGRLAVDAYEIARRLPVARSLIEAIGPSFALVARRR
jgi:SAM-dependent methyltransferase